MTILGHEIKHTRWPGKTTCCLKHTEKRVYVDFVQMDRIARDVDLPMITVLKVVVRHELGHAEDFSRRGFNKFVGRYLVGGQSRVDAEIDAWMYGWEFDHELLRVSAKDYSRLANYALYHYEHDYLTKSRETATRAVIGDCIALAIRLSNPPKEELDKVVPGVVY